MLLLQVRDGEEFMGELEDWGRGVGNKEGHKGRGTLNKKSGCVFYIRRMTTFIFDFYVYIFVPERMGLVQWF
jgi:hypothetical protein